MSRKLLLIGGGGHCRSVLDSILAAGIYDEIGIVDKDRGSAINGAVFVGNDDGLPALFRGGWKEAFITVGSIGDTALRRRLKALVCGIGFELPVITDPSAVLARDVILHPGVFIGKRAVVNAGSEIGTCAIINSGAIVEHDCRVGSFAHVSPGAVLCGQTTAGDDVHIGAGSVVKQGVQIGAGAMIGAGSVVLKDIPAQAAAWGNPCRVARES